MTPGTKTGLTAAGLTGLAALAVLAHRQYNAGNSRNRPHDFLPGESQESYDKLADLARSKGVPVHIVGKDDPRYTLGPHSNYYPDGSPSDVVIPETNKDEAILAHEVGHALAPSWLNAVGSHPTVRSATIPALATLGSIAASAAGHTDVGLAVGGAGALSSLPALISEYVASRKGEELADEAGSKTDRKAIYGGILSQALPRLLPIVPPLAMMAAKKLVKQSSSAEDASDYTDFINDVFAEKVQDIRDIYGKDISYMSWFPSEVPLDSKGDPYQGGDNDETGGSWTKDKKVAINPHPERVVKRWGLKETPEDFLRRIIGHELLHELQHRKHMTKARMKKIVEQAMEEGFSTPYLDNVSDHHKDKETMVEYMNEKLLARDSARAAEKIYEDLTDEQKKLLSPSGKFSENPNMLFRVLNDDKTGFAEVGALNGKSQDKGFVSLAVSPEVQGKGVGRALVEKLLEAARKRKIKQLIWRLASGNDASRKLVSRYADGPSRRFKDSEEWRIDL